MLLTYKRKRLLSSGTVPQENGYPLLSAECASHKTSNISDKREELAEANKSGNSREDFEKLGAEGKILCSSGARQQDLLIFSQESNRMEENSAMQDVKQVISDLHVVSVRSPSEDTDEVAPGNHLIIGFRSEANSYSTQEGSHSCLNPSSACGDKSTENCLALSSVGVNIVSEPDPVDLKSSMGGDQLHECININALDKRSDALIEDEINGSRTYALKRKSTSLITFRRRSKQKNDHNQLQALDISSLGVNTSLPLEGCKSAGSANACDSTSLTNCSMQSPENQSPSKKKLSSVHSLNSSQDIFYGDVNDSCACTRSIPEIGRFKQVQEKLGSTLKDRASNVEEVLPQESGTNHSSLQIGIGLDLRETPIGAGNSLDDPESDPSHGPVLPTCHEFLGKKISKFIRWWSD